MLATETSVYSIQTSKNTAYSFSPLLLWNLGIVTSSKKINVALWPIYHLRSIKLPHVVTVCTTDCTENLAMDKNIYSVVRWWELLMVFKVFRSRPSLMSMITVIYWMSFYFTFPLNFVSSFILFFSNLVWLFFLFGKWRDVATNLSFISFSCHLLALQKYYPHSLQKRGPLEAK